MAQRPWHRGKGMSRTRTDKERRIRLDQNRHKHELKKRKKDSHHMNFAGMERPKRGGITFAKFAQIFKKRAEK